MYLLTIRMASLEKCLFKSLAHLEAPQKMKNGATTQSSNPASGYLSTRVDIGIREVLALQRHYAMHNGQVGAT